MTRQWKAVTATPTRKANDDDRTVSAVFATLGVEDSHGDIILPGHLGTQDVAMVWHHDWTRPIGKGRIREDGDLAIFDGAFFDTADGRDAHETVKQMGSLQEWSFGFWSHPDSVTWKEDGDRVVRILGPLPDGGVGADVAEVSPVLRGAGVNTRTLAVKTADGPTPINITVDPAGFVTLTGADGAVIATYLVGDDGLERRTRLTDHLTRASLAVDRVVERLDQLVTLRADEGRQPSADTLEHASRLAERLYGAAEKIRALVPDQPDPATLDLWKALLTEQGRRLGWELPTT